MEKLSMHNFAAKLSAQMARPELTRAHWNEQILSLRYPQNQVARLQKAESLR